MSKVTQFFRSDRFLQFLLILSVLLVAGFIVYRINYVRSLSSQQDAYERMAQEALANRVDLNSPSSESDQGSETEDPDVEPQQPEIDVIAAFLEIEGNQEKYGEYLLNGVPDFSVLRATNPDIIAYLVLPDSVINYPVLQNADNSYYLDHNIDGSTGYPGCLYTETFNSPDFHDPATVIYGHHLTSGGMFSDIEDYLDPAYMNDHIYYFLYLPNEIQIYEVVMAAKFSNQHLLVNSFYLADDGLYHFNGFQGGEGKEIYDMVEAAGMEGNFRSQHAPTENDRMLFWATCFAARDRRMVVGARQITADNIDQLQ